MSSSVEESPIPDLHNKSREGLVNSEISKN